MSIVISVKVQDGVVLASDSCVIHRERSYFQAEKTLNPIRGLPIGVMIVGDGSIGVSSVANHLRDYGQLAKVRSGPWSLSKTHYTLGGIAAQMCRYLKEVAQISEEDGHTALTIVGYSADRPLPETWRISINAAQPSEPELIWGENEYGVTWDGERECLDRLLCGTSQSFPSVLTDFGLSSDQSAELQARVADACGSEVVTPGMPLQDAVELARFLAETTISFVGFSQSGELKTVGGPVDIAAITRHDGFRWIQRKRSLSVVANR